MKKIIAIILCIVLAALSLTACSIDIGKKDGETTTKKSSSNSSDNSRSDNNGNSESGRSNSDGDDVTEVPTNAAGFVDSEYASEVFTTPAQAGSTVNAVADPSGEGMRFVFDESGRIAKCYYMAGGQEVYLNYVYAEGWVEIYGFIGETLVCDEVITLYGEYNPDVGFALVNGYYVKGYVF